MKGRLCHIEACVSDSEEVNKVLASEPNKKGLGGHSSDR